MESDYIDLSQVIDRLDRIDKKLDSLFHDVPEYEPTLNKRIDDPKDMKPIQLFKSSRSIRHTLEQRSIRIKKENPSGLAS